MKLLKTAQGTILDIYVKPKSKEFKINTENDELTVYCRGTPVKGIANREVIKECSRLFKKKVEILSGFGSRQKKILINDIGVNEVQEILSRS